MDIAINQGPWRQEGEKKQQVWTESATSCSIDTRQMPEFRDFIAQGRASAAMVVKTTYAPALQISNASSRSYFANGFDKTSPPLIWPTVVSDRSGINLMPPVSLVAKDGVRDREAFEKAKREGRIYICPYSHVSLNVADRPHVTSYDAMGETTVGNVARVTPSGSRRACNRTLYSFPSGDTAYVPNLNQVNEWYANALYHVYKNAQVESTIRGYEPLFEDLLKDVSATIWDEPFDAGLITAGTAELNSAYWDVATELGELPETIGMIYNALRAILNKYLEARRKIKTLKANSISSGGILTDVASVWMGYRYGIQPIVYSINDALDYLERQGVFRTVRQGLNQTFSIVTPHGPVTFSGRDRYWGKAKIDPTQNLADLKFNLLSTAWELVPLSFVVDWVLNVGDFLSALTGPSGATEVKHSYSRRCTGIIPVTLRGESLPVEISFYRYIPINPLAYISLTADPTMTWKRVLDALSLSWFQVKSDFRRKL